MQRRVVVTGLGVVCALGDNRDEFWQKLLSGHDVVGEPDSFDATPYRSKRTTVIARSMLDELPHKELHDPARLGLSAAVEALRQSGLVASEYNKAGLAIGTTSGGTMDAFSAAYNFGDTVGDNMPEQAAAHSSMTAIARHLELKGPVYNTSMACVSSSVAILHAAETIRHGDAEIMLAGGCDRVRRADFAGFNSLRAVSPDYCRPFDRDRKGLVMGDGAAFLVLESLDRATARGAHLLAELGGEGLTCDAHHATAPDPDGIKRAMRQALDNAGLDSSQIDYINCHGTGTPLNDKAEMEAIEDVFGQHASKLCVSSTKAVTGHLLGTAGAIEALITVMAIAHDIVPPVTNCREPEPSINFRLVRDKPLETHIKHAMSNSLGFGGNNASLIFSAVHS